MEKIRSDENELLIVELENKDDYVVASSSIRTDLCGSCRQAVAKYRCPRCERRSCSLACVDKHKKEAKCHGRRSVARVATNQFSDDVLRADVRFLDHVAQVTERSARATSKLFGERLAEQSMKSPCWKKHIGISVLKKKCDERAIKLRVCPSNLSMRKSNTTTLTRKSKKLSWRIQWLFPLCGEGHTDTRYEVERIRSEQICLSAL